MSRLATCLFSCFLGDGGEDGQAAASAKTAGPLGSVDGFVWDVGVPANGSNPLTWHAQVFNKCLEFKPFLILRQGGWGSGNVKCKKKKKCKMETK